MVVALLLRRNVLEVNAYTVRFSVLKLLTALLTLSDVLITLALPPQASAIIQAALVKMLPNAGMAFV